MPSPGIVVGRNILAPEGLDGEPQGRFFSSFPGATPKYALNNGARRSEFVETMARLSIILPPQSRTRLLATLPTATRAAAQTLLYGGNVTSFRDGNDAGGGYFDFLLTNVQQAQQEREQAVDTLTDNTVIFYSGQSAPTLACAGMFLNTFQNDQNVWFQLLYHNLLRGTALARHGITARFKYDSFFVTGYLMNLSVSTEGGAKDYVQFSFNFRVKQIDVATPILFNPTLFLRTRSTNAIVQDTTPGADDTTRIGVEASEQPASPLSVPGATSAPAVAPPPGAESTTPAEALAPPAEIDEREQATVQGVPPRELQAERDAQVVEQQGDATTTIMTEGVDRAALDDATAPRVTPSGDLGDQVRQASTALQDFRTAGAAAALGVAPTAPESASSTPSSVDPVLQEDRTTRGTTLIPATGDAPVQAGVIATEVAHAAAEVERTRPSTPSRSARAPVRDASSQSLTDVYRPTGVLLLDLTRAQASATRQQSFTGPRGPDLNYTQADPVNMSSAPRTRGRPTP